jgi:hypothetical protein
MAHTGDGGDGDDDDDDDGPGNVDTVQGAGGAKRRRDLAKATGMYRERGLSRLNEGRASTSSTCT